MLEYWSVGVLEFEAMSRGEDIYLIEINPRFPAWVYFATMLGINLPQMLIKLMNNEKVEEKFDYPLEKMYVRYVEEIVSEFKIFRL